MYFFVQHNAPREMLTSVLFSPGFEDLLTSCIACGQNNLYEQHEKCKKCLEVSPELEKDLNLGTIYLKATDCFSHCDV